jgi:hypothetical protein
VLSSLLLETDPGGRFLHTELSTTAGLLTLHPEAGGTIHGNVLTAAGIGHVVGLPWAPDGLLVLEASPIAAAAAVGLLAGIGVGESGSPAGIVIGPGLEVRAGPVLVQRLAAWSWSIAGVGEIGLTPDGLPALAGAALWPLETE